MVQQRQRERGPPLRGHRLPNVPCFGRRPTGEEIAAVAYRNVLPFEDDLTQGESHAEGATALRAIKRRCFDCSGCSKADVRNCKFTDCDLWPFRQGKNPNRVLSWEALEAARANGARLADRRLAAKIDASTADSAAVLPAKLPP